MNILKKVCNISLFLIVFFLIGNISVKGNTKTDYDAKTDPYTSGSCDISWNYCWRTVGAAPLQGIRVSAYNQQGEKISDIVDFTNDITAISVIENNKYIMADNKKSKVDYINKGANVSQTIDTPKIKHLDFLPFIDTNLTSSSTIEYILKIEEDSSDLLNSLYSAINFCQNSYASKCSSGTYLVIEPLTIIWTRDNSLPDYYGTYYELTYMIENSTKPFQKGNGVSPFLPGGVSRSIYISGNENTNLKSFYNKVNLEPISTSELNKVKTYSDNYNHNALKTLTVGANNVNKGYGIGIMSVKYEIEPPEITSTDCKVDISYDLCNDKKNGKTEAGTIAVSYSGCPFVDDNGKQYSVKYNPKSHFIGTSMAESSNLITLCEIQCDEKYYIEAWGLDNNLNPEFGILAGSYVAINSPTVYHKKTCKVNKIEKNINAAASSVANAFAQLGISFNDTYKTTVNEINYQCQNLSKSFSSVASNEKEDAENDSVGDLTLSLFSDYTLKAKKTNTIVGVIDGVNYEYGYHNTFVYSIDGNVNKYINLKNIVNDNTDTANETNVGDGVAKITTPITSISSSFYKYGINFYDIFSNNTDFINVINTKNDNKTYFNDIDVSCNYTIMQRNISNVCDPTTDSNKCGGDPNNDFGITPKIKMQYRPINLSNPFPGKLGLKRKAGANWQPIVSIQSDLAEEITNPVDIYITRNRKLTGEQSPEDIYTDREPIYTITLNSSNISAIREYNETHKYDDFELSCREGNGTECISSFLRDTKYIDLGGTCSEITTNDRTDFYSCADK